MDKLTLANSDFSKTATAGKITIEHKGGLNHHGAVELTGTAFDFGGHAANTAGDAGYEPRIKAGSFYLIPRATNLHCPQVAFMLEATLGKTASFKLATGREL